MKGIIACVLKSGGDFLPEHVYWLQRQCVEHMPEWEFRCWSDMFEDSFVTVEDTARAVCWPKWWAKMHIYRDTYDLPDAVLVVDLDTVFLKTLHILPEHADKAIFLRDCWKDGFKSPERLGGGFTYLPQWARREIWDAWIKDPEDIMARWSGDDQPFYHSLFADRALRWQDHYLDEVVSYKKHVRALGIQPDNKVCYWHGSPRPWECSDDFVPPLHAQRPAQEAA